MEGDTDSLVSCLKADPPLAGGLCSLTLSLDRPLLIMAVGQTGHL